MNEMNDKEIIEMADQADRMSNAEETDKHFIFHFARLIAEKQKVIDAVICENMNENIGDSLLYDAAAAIRNSGGAA